MIPAGPRWIDTLRFMKQDPVFSECDLMDLMVNTYLNKYHEYHDDVSKNCWMHLFN